MLSEIERIALEAVVETARRPPSLRGPYVFDEEALQERAREAKALLKRNVQPNN